jgi:hypothetical protein
MEFDALTWIGIWLALFAIFTFFALLFEVLYLEWKARRSEYVDVNRVLFGSDDEERRK